MKRIIIPSWSMLFLNLHHFSKQSGLLHLRSLARTSNLWLILIIKRIWAWECYRHILREHPLATLQHSNWIEETHSSTPSFWQFSTWQRFYVLFSLSFELSKLSNAGIYVTPRSLSFTLTILIGFTEFYKSSLIRGYESFREPTT